MTPISNQSELLNAGSPAIFLFAADDGIEAGQASFVAFHGNGQQTIYVTQVPEPAGWMLVLAGAGLIALLHRIRRRR